MSRFIVVLLVLVVGVACLGFYLGWFHFSADNTGDKSNFSIEIDKDKIRKDEEKAKEKLEEAGQKVKESIKTGAKESKDETPKP